ncbi:MAG: hypothetical protein QNJ74_05795 [Trichodesmium sp. MO_231.B1]|nr:hypothetical protein [Trichodesmium sp. MO_231.B1]
MALSTPPTIPAKLPKIPIIPELSHQSCLILNTWELPLEIVDLKNKNAPVSCLQLECLGKTANKILEKEGLLDEDKWSDGLN